MLRALRDRPAHQHRERLTRPMVRLKAPKNQASVGFGGAEYEVRDGFVEVPEAAETVLRPHGYKPAAEPERKPQKKGR